jgi:hypothetical protein
MDFSSYFKTESKDSKKTSTKKISTKTTSGKGDKEKQCGG